MDLSICVPGTKFEEADYGSPSRVRLNFQPFFFFNTTTTTKESSYFNNRE